MSTPHEVARDPGSMASITAAYVADFLKSSAEAAERASKTGDNAHAFGYLHSAVEQAIRMLDQERLDLQAGSGDATQGREEDASVILGASAPAAGKGTPRCHRDGLLCGTNPHDRCLDCPLGGLPPVSDAEAEAVADSLVGQPVDSHVSRAYVGPGPERLKARFRW